MEPGAWVFIGTVVGAATSIATTWLATKTTQKVQDAKAREEQLERAREFQRKTVLELQESIHDCARLASRLFTENWTARRESGVDWGVDTISPEINEESRLALRKIGILVERLGNATLRDEVRQFTKLRALLIMATSEEAAGAGLHEVGAAAAQLIQSLGAELRRHYPELAIVTQ